MSWPLIEAEIRALADAMAPPAYALDWSVGYRADRSYEAPTLVLETPVTGPFESDVSAEGGINSQQWRLRRRVYLVARVVSDLLIADDEQMIQANQDALERARGDILKRFDGTIPNSLCALGVRKVSYINASKRALPSAGIYYPYELVLTYDIDYITKRGTI